MCKSWETASCLSRDLVEPLHLTHTCGYLLWTHTRLALSTVLEGGAHRVIPFAAEVLAGEWFHF